MSFFLEGGFGMNLVDVDKLKELIADPDDSPRYGYLCMFELEDAEIIEAEPVKHGKWKSKETPSRLWVCSECEGLVNVGYYCNSCYYDYLLSVLWS